MRVAALHTYPVKGCRRLDHPHAMVQPWGLAGDRRWLVTDGEGELLTQREEPRLTRIQPTLLPGTPATLRLAAPDQPAVELPAVPGDLAPVTVWLSTIEATRVGEDADAWLSGVLSRKARLYYLDDPTRRGVDPDYARPDDRVSFADGYPLLLANAASLAVLNDWLAEDGSPEWPLPMTRFRPNLVVTGAPAWAEDGWVGGRLRIGAVVLRAPKPCDRCVVTTTDQDTGVRGHEPLRTLARHRRINRKLLFGLNLVPDGTGEIAVGDEVAVLD